MKLYLIAALFLATLVVVPCLADEEIKNAETANFADFPEEKPVEGDPPGSTGDEVEIKEEEKNDSDEDVPEEFKDEVEQVKRRVPQLSRQSCLILKRYGYCRNRAIARFCDNICECIDKLSSLSCRKVKYTYRACNQNVGRVYCRKTCGNCGGGGKLPQQCYNYKRIDDITRRQSRPRGKVLLCDNKLLGWYRFVGKTGTYIPNKCVPSNRCGTHATGWVNGNYPAVRGRTVDRQVCFNYASKCCWHKTQIKITNCGGFYVFYLKNPNGCSLRYCGNA